MTEYHKIACLGGVYSNYLALQAALDDLRKRDVEAIFCLGDLGAFGPYPDRTIEMVQQNNVLCLQGNYDDSIGNALDDCQCGYTDPRDNYFAQISYDYTLKNSSASSRAFLRTLPQQRRIRLGQTETLLCHGSPRRVNEFLWESTTSSQFLNELLVQHEVSLMLATHTGIKWQRELAAGQFVNVGVLGRPENDGTPRVWYTLIETTAAGVAVEFVPVDYDHMRLGREMQSEGLPQEFIDTILHGWWSTCLEILPVKERRRGIY
jgi:predicted phosphodiesterase